MPFGLSSAPLTWTKVMRPVVQHLREQDFRIMAYVDDFGGAPPAAAGLSERRAQAVAAYRIVELLFDELGLMMHLLKSVRDGPTQVRLLGHLVDNRVGRFLLPADRAYKLVGQALALSRHAMGYRRWVNFAALRRACGTAVSTTRSVPTDRYHLRSLSTALRYRHPSSGDVSLGRHATKDLLWWTELQGHAATGRSIWLGAASMLLDTDASGPGWGTVLDQHAEAWGYHGIDRNGLHINCLELGEVTRALHSFEHLNPGGSVIRLRTDSMVALGVMRAGSSRSPALMTETRDLHELFSDMKVELRVDHVSSVLNDWAYRPARENDFTDWTLGSASFSRLDAIYGPHSVDLFASSIKTKCERFYSGWIFPGAVGVKSLRHNWHGENARANPSFHLVVAVITHILTVNATATLIAPEWRAQPWWRRAVHGCTEWHRLPAEDWVFTHGSASGPGIWPFWRTVVFRFAQIPLCATTPSAGGTC